MAYSAKLENLSPGIFLKHAVVFVTVIAIGACDEQSSNKEACFSAQQQGRANAFAS
jgi:hypothetical protein